METRDFGRALVVSSDLRGYGRGNDKRHETMQAEFVALHQQAAEEAGLNRDAWVRQPGGDGELAVLPAGEPEALVVDQYVRALDERLRGRNGDLPAEERLRLRMAAAFGSAYPAANGYAGQAVVEASRLLAWQPLKRILDEKPDVNLVLILSQRVFDDTVRQGHTSHSTRTFLEVKVQEKEYEAPAWIWVPGMNPEELDFLHKSTDTGATVSPVNGLVGTISQDAEVITNLYGPVDARQSVFGVSRK
ncbi:hypothetical protein ABT294_09120 [Nonomuraea sp. NPDC000554]|uniref:hypothetical protein n=1 Tax=Nonomuraea sp. NPDC000554 TaxID=3154259 RepID=UPI00332B8AC3